MSIIRLVYAINMLINMWITIHGPKGWLVGSDQLAVGLPKARSGGWFYQKCQVCTGGWGCFPPLFYPKTAIRWSLLSELGRKAQGNEFYRGGLGIEAQGFENSVDDL